MIDLEDPVALTQALVRCPSVTPEDGGAQRLLASWLERLGFVVHRLRFGGDGTAPVENLFARIGDGGPHLAFAGHTDVVPPGDASSWHVDPFAATIEGDELIGRGAGASRPTPLAPDSRQKKSPESGTLGAFWRSRRDLNPRPPA